MWRLGPGGLSGGRKMTNRYAELCLTIQAIRRYYEGIRTPLAPALGVAASVYTHQLANVQRVLTDLQVRHLLADEVGLGKTVEALMVLNALKHQRENLKALVIVPDRLVPQWRDEIMTRAHTAPIGEGEQFEGHQYIRLAWEAQLRQTDSDGRNRFSLSEISSDRFDVLIVDELHRLRTDLQDRIVRAAPDFDHLLILTATPAFQRVERHAQIFALLEPQRTAISRWGVVHSTRNVAGQLSMADDLSNWPAWAATAIVEEFVRRDRDAAELADDNAVTAIALSHCAYRRVIRTRRIDFGEFLPRRSHHPLVINPLGAEVDRQSLMWRYFSFLKELSLGIDKVLLAKRVILSPPSLEQRVDFLRRKGHERDGLLEQVKPLVNRTQGDSRADALVDLLADLWSYDPTERVLVAAQDNLTVDYLFDLVQARLPTVGPLRHRIPLVAARIRQGMMTEAVEELGAFGNETNENLEAFQRGDAQVLFAPEAAQVGLNLQCARILVLYSVPWRPEEVEQWIGRLDRIGNAAAFTTDGTARTIDVYTIVQRGLVDERVVTVLQRFHVFEHSVNLDGGHLDEVAKKIEDAALGVGALAWHELEDETEAMADEDEAQELDSPLRSLLPWHIGFARDVRGYVESLPAAPPLLSRRSARPSRGSRAMENGLDGLVKLLKQAGEYNVRWNEDPNGGGFGTLWYQFGERGMYGGREVLSRVLFSFGADPSQERSPRYAHAFITRRDDIWSPPRRSVTLQLDHDNVDRPLHFFNFGDALHDEWIGGWLNRFSEGMIMEVSFFDDHIFWEHGMEGVYLVRIAILDSAQALPTEKIEQRTLRLVVECARRTAIERLPEIVEPFKRAIRRAVEADVRWLRSELAAELRLDAWRLEADRWVRAANAECVALLNPIGHKRRGVPSARPFNPSDAEREAMFAQLETCRTNDATAAKESWSHRFPEFEEALAIRLRVIEEESKDAINVAKAELQAAEEAAALADERGNRPQTVRAQRVVDTAADIVAMTKTLWEQRVRWLKDCGHEVRTLKPDERLVSLLRTAMSK